MGGTVAENIVTDYIYRRCRSNKCRPGKIPGPRRPMCEQCVETVRTNWRNCEQLADLMPTLVLTVWQPCGGTVAHIV